MSEIAQAVAKAEFPLKLECLVSEKVRHRPVDHAAYSDRSSSHCASIGFFLGSVLSIESGLPIFVASSFFDSQLFPCTDRLNWTIA
jgi:hypothetical protein